MKIIANILKPVKNVRLAALKVVVQNVKKKTLRFQNHLQIPPTKNLIRRRIRIKEMKSPDMFLLKIIKIKGLKMWISQDMSVLRALKK